MSRLTDAANRRSRLTARNQRTARIDALLKVASRAASEGMEPKADRALTKAEAELNRAERYEQPGLLA